MREKKRAQFMGIEVSKVHKGIKRFDMPFSLFRFLKERRRVLAQLQENSNPEAERQPKEKRKQLVHVCRCE